MSIFTIVLIRVYMWWASGSHWGVLWLLSVQSHWFCDYTPPSFTPKVLCLPGVWDDVTNCTPFNLSSFSGLPQLESVMAFQLTFQCRLMVWVESKDVSGENDSSQQLSRSFKGTGVSASQASASSALTEWASWWWTASVWMACPLLQERGHGSNVAMSNSRG